jgi:meiotic recombination protein SPO11
LVRQLWKFLGVPVLALVDADPHGIEIMCVYRFGSLVSGTEHETSLAKENQITL